MILRVQFCQSIFTQYFLHGINQSLRLFFFSFSLSKILGNIFTHVQKMCGVRVSSLSNTMLWVAQNL